MKKSLLLITLLLTSVFCFSNKGITPTNYLNDYTGSLTDGQVQSLNSKLSEYEKSTGIEIAIAIVETLNGSEIDVYKTELFSEWGVGKKGADNGLLLVVAPNEHKYGVETGYGLEGFLPDAVCYSIAESTMPDNFRAGDYYSGINGFVDDVLGELGKISWEERLEMKRKEDAAFKAQLAKIWDGFLDFLFYAFIFGLIILFVVLYIKYDKKRRVFNIFKDGYVQKYGDYLIEANNDLKRLGVTLLVSNEALIKKIRNSKTEQECVNNYHDSIKSFIEPRNKVKLIDQINKELAFNKTLIDKATIKIEECKVNMETLTPYSFSYSFSYYYNIDVLEITLNTIQVDNTKLNILISDLDKYRDLINFSLKKEDIDKLVNKYIDKYSNELFKIDVNVINKYGVKIVKSLDNFYSIEQKFDNLDLLNQPYENYIECYRNLGDYVIDVHRKNVEYRQKVNDIKNHKETLNNYAEKLTKLSKNSDVSKHNKSSIDSLLLLLLAFSITNDVLETHDNLTNLCRECDSLIKRCNSDIDSENDNRRRAKESEERKKRDDDYERNRSSYSSYGSSSSYSSYDSSSSSSSSFSDFGGGSSGGGGCSGGW